MKGFSHQKRLITFLCLVSLGSCSWLQSRQSLFDETSESQASDTTVPKEQYDQLLQKYEALQTQLQTQDAQPPLETPADQAILGDLQNASSAELAETVDVFANGTINSADQTVTLASTYENVDVEGQIRQLQQAEALVNQNKFDEALNLLKPLERSQVRQVRVRARFLLGESLFKQGNFDLSMQIFEEIIQKDAFSGTVLKALGRLIVCAEKLKLDQKKEQYYSLLHDFFEA